MFANHISLTNDHAAQIGSWMCMLRKAAEHGPFTDGRFSTEIRPGADRDVGNQATALANLNTRFDDTKGANIDVIAQNCSGANDRRRVYLHD